MNKFIQIPKWSFLVLIGSSIFTAITIQFFIYYDLQSQNANANLNVARMDGMHCQGVATLVLHVHNHIQETGEVNYVCTQRLQKGLSQLNSCHQFLLNQRKLERTSEDINALLKCTTPNVLIKRCGWEFMRNPVQEVAERAVALVSYNAIPVCFVMEQTIATYQEEPHQKLARIKIIEWILGGFTILIVLLAFIHIFLPSLRKLFPYNTDLSQANAKSTALEEEIRSNLDQISNLQKQLEINGLKYRSLIENSHDLIAVFDMDGNYTFVSNSSKEIMGYDPDELIGRFGLEFVHPDDRLKLVEEPLRKVFEGVKVLNPEFRLRRKDGEYIWIEAYSIPILNENGKVVALQTANRDITERKRVEEALKRSEERYRLVSENSQDFIALHKPDGTYVFVSPSVKNLLGYDPAELLNTSGFDLIHPEDFVQFVEEAKRNALIGKVVLGTQFRMRKKDNSYVWVEAYTKPILNSKNEITTVQTSARDITQRKKFEDKIVEAKEQSEKISNQLAELLNDKNDLIGLFSHDLRSPINQIKGIIELMRLSINDKATLKLYLEKMGDVTTRQLDLFESILIMLKSDQISLQRNEHTRLQLAFIITSTLNNLKWLYTSKNIDLVVSIPEGIEIEVHQNLFTQAIYNLVSNAIKFTPMGKSVRIDAWEEDYHIKIAIRDDGIGFDPNKAERLFDRFTLEGRNGTQNETSTGLGLYLAKKIITNHSGTISAESQGAGTGATFTISIEKK